MQRRYGGHYSLHHLHLFIRRRLVPRSVEVTDSCKRLSEKTWYDNLHAELRSYNSTADSNNLLIQLEKYRNEHLRGTVMDTPKVLLAPVPCWELPLVHKPQQALSKNTADIRVSWIVSDESWTTAARWVWFLDYISSQFRD